MHSLEAQVLAALGRAGYAKGNSRLVVAVSGGPDSMALLYALVALQVEVGLDLHVAHLNHDFRGDEAEVDARFVAQVSVELGLSSTIGTADPAAYQRATGLSSFEEAAREVRYTFLTEVAEATQADAVALGHNSDDLAETVLMHIIRGSGVRGLRGMQELSPWLSRDGAKTVVLFRPLLDVSKDQTKEYCNDRGIVCRNDSGNVLMRFTRNRIRHDLLPSMEEYNPQIKGALARLARISAMEADFIEAEVQRSWDAVAGWDRDQVTLDAGTLMSFHPLLQRLVLRKAYEEVVGNQRRLAEPHLVAMARILNSDSMGTLSLPKEIVLTRSYDRLVLGKDPDALCPFPDLTGTHPITLPEASSPHISWVPGWRITIQDISSQGEFPKEPFIAHLDRSAIEGDLQVRTRRPGDRFQPLGTQSTKKIQDFYVDQKIPRTWRDKIPLLVSDQGIAWVVGYRPAQWAKISKDTEHVCRIQFEAADLV